MNRKLIVTAIYCLFLGFSQAQSCPPSTDNQTHVVQAGETLFSLSRKYNISVEDIKRWNNMQSADILRTCAKISVVNPTLRGKSPKTEVSVSETRPKQRAEGNEGFVIPANDVHIVKQGETVASISRKYGYTEERLRTMNNLKINQVVKPGQELLVTGCGLCGQIPAKVEPTPTPKPAFTPTTEKPASTTKPVVSTAGVTSGNYEEADINKLIALNESYEGSSAFPKVVHVVSQGESLGLIGQLYGMTEAEIMKMNGLQRGNQIFENQKLLVEDRKQGNWEPIHTDIETSSSMTETPVSSETYLPPVNTEPTVEVETETPIVETPMSNPNSAMSVEEYGMLDEINLLRRNPVGYIPFVEVYIKEMQAKNNTGAVKSARELIAELRTTSAVGILEAKDCIYTAAKKHGDEQKGRGSLNHDGLDGTWPWDRMMRECAEVTDGNENLIGNTTDIRRAVVLLLVDDGIESRGHRKILLNPDWKYAACYKLGMVGELPNCWLQDFAY